MAMDMVVNDYLEHVDRDAVTVANVNARFGLLLKRFRTIEYYAKAIDKVMKENQISLCPSIMQIQRLLWNLILKLAMIFGMNLILLIQIRWTKSQSAINEASKGDMEGYVKSLIDTFQKRDALCRGIFISKS